MSLLRQGSVGVVIPSYNSAEFLEETVASAMAQTVPVAQVVLVDDASPDDDSYAIGQRLAQQNPVITSVRQENGGAAAARNTGVGYLETEFVIFLDADDRLAPDAVAHHLKAFSEHPDAVLTIGENNVVDRNGRILHEARAPAEIVDRDKLALRVTPCPSQCMYRVASFLEVGRFDPTFRPGDEIDLNLRLERVGKIYSHGHYVMDYRDHPGQGTKRRVYNARAHLRALEENLGPAAPSPDVVLYRLARRRWLARYGRAQFRSALGQLRRGHLGNAAAAGKLWLDAVPAWIQNAVFGPPRIP